MPPPSDTTPVADPAPTPTHAAAVGDVQIRVEWIDVPPVARTPTGKTACGSPRPAAVSPTTTWGIPEVVVIVDGAPAPGGEARLRVADCVVTPRVAVGSTLSVDSAMDRPAKLVLAKRRIATDPRAKLEATEARAILLPVTGHEVVAPLVNGAIYELVVEEPASKGAMESAWVVAAGASITDPSGVVLVRDVPIGTHQIRAWLPPRGGQPERSATGEVTIVADDLAELTLTLAP